MSSHQGSVNWKQVYADGVRFAFVKTSEGKDWTDPTWTKARYQDMTKNKIIVGCYHFARPQPGRSPETEADFFFSRVKAVTGLPKAIGVGMLPLCLDIETSKLNDVQTAEWADKFSKRILKLTGRGVITYTSPGVWSNITGGRGAPSRGGDLWVAHYGPKAGHPTVPKGFVSWKFHQYTDKGKVSGVSGAVDVNVYRGDLKSLRRYVGLTSTAQPAKAPTKPTKTPAAHLPKPGASRIRPKSVPGFVPEKYWWHWQHPWEDKAKRSGGFRSLLDKHGYLTPNFRISESRCKDGTYVPKNLKLAARNHAFNLEKVRHIIGDQSMTPISWYRHPAYNAKIGGAKNSMHTKAVATDFSREWVQKVGRERVLKAGETVFKNGGMGVYPGGNIHFDSRGFRARWTTW